MRFLLLIVLALQGQTVGTPVGGGDEPGVDPVRGRLCLRQPGAPMILGRCQTVEGTRLAIEPSVDDRIFAWISSDQETLALGYVKAESESIELPDDQLAVWLEIEGDSERDWPQTTTLAIGPRGAPGR